MSLLRRVIGGVLRRVRLRQGRTLREVAQAADVSLPYLSEVERGRKEASSEVLAAICRALGIHLSDLLEEARDELRRVERRVPAVSGSGLARVERVPAGRRDGGGPHLRIGSRPGTPLAHVTRRPAGSVPLGAQRMPRVDVGLPSGGGWHVGTGIAPGSPTTVGTGTRVWMIPATPAGRSRPRTSGPLARRRARSGRRRLTRV